jgi:hypothetical protein
MIQILWFFIQTYWIPIVAVLFLIFALVIVRHGLKDAKEMDAKFINNFSDEDLIFQKELRMKYLNECIEKATPNLSKIKDVDKELAEIRGEIQLPDEYSPETALGDDKQRPKFKDYNDYEPDDNFM